MARVLVAALVAMIIAILSGPTFIAFLRKHEFGQHIREEGLQHHAAKQGTPTMGGLLILAAATIAFLPLSDYTLPALTIFGTALACGGVGFLDDYIKLRHQRSLGLRGRWKMLLLLGITVAVGFAAHHQQLRHDVFIPVGRQVAAARAVLVRAAVPDHRRRRQRREPDRRRRRARGRAPGSSPSRRSPRWR